MFRLLNKAAKWVISLLVSIAHYFYINIRQSWRSRQVAYQARLDIQHRLNYMAAKGEVISTLNPVILEIFNSASRRAQSEYKMNMDKVRAIAELKTEFESALFKTINEPHNDNK